eukprot:TRINITY_DN20093_c0_g1_i3.p1 TRINITY_DN20093_c0_g1~~TRINITY_DN20093_c0_g1_i3.p1  ORF type:complete len:167 (-),score=64.15 TRINITY_DN20093_c0_g1_i3:73-573(-)
MLRSLVGSEMCIRDRYQRRVRGNPLVAMAEGAERFGLLCAQLRRIYDALDTNANGRLSKVEMRAAVDKCAAAADEADDVPMEGADRHVQALFQHLDLDQDGDISFEEVLAGFRSMPESPDDLEAALADQPEDCLLYTSDAADEEDSVDLGGRRIIKKKKKVENDSR